MRSVRPRERHHAVAELGNGQGDVVSRRQLYAEGITRWEVRAQLRGRRWQLMGRQSIALHTGPVAELGQWFAAVFEAGPRAFLDGASALVAAGLRGWQSEALRISVPRGVPARRVRGLDVRQTRRWRADDVMPNGVPRSRVEVAAVRAALWARSQAQAALVLTMVVQQGLSTPERIAVEMLTVRRDRRRTFIHAVLLDLIGGVGSLGELEFARECRRRGLPEPSRQQVRRGRQGRYYLDVSWEQWGLVVEIDGIHHTWAENVVNDALRHNTVTLQNAVVLRLPLLGLRVAPEEFFDQIRQALIAAGCPLVA